MPKDKETVLLNGVPVMKGWPEKLADAQLTKVYKIKGLNYSRIRYGDEDDDWGADRQPCHDCAAAKGQFHAFGCDVERCPCCKNQFISCDCPCQEGSMDEDEGQFDFNTHKQAAVAAYLEKRFFFKEHASVIKRIVEEALLRRGIKVSSVEAREKDPESFGRKAAQPSDSNPTKPKYDSPMQQITDLTGVRIITFFPNTLELVGELLAEEFDVIEKTDKTAMLHAEERFGYSSVHYLVRLNKSRLALPEYQKFKGTTAEVQVRTVLQHAWAEIEHDIQYKSASVIPASIRRRFTALAGMLELADREFQAVQDEDDRIRQTARAQIDEGELSDVEITPDALKQFLDKTIGRDDRISSVSYDFAARELRALGFSTLDQVRECIAGYDDDKISRIVYGNRQGQLYRFFLVVAAGIGQLYAVRHPWSKHGWFQVRTAKTFEELESAGIKIGSYDPLL